MDKTTASGPIVAIVIAVIVVLCILLVWAAISVIVMFTLLGPALGNVFSNSVTQAAWPTGF